MHLLACGEELALPLQDHLRWILTGGDDYELVFTAPAALREQVSQASVLAQTPVTRIGLITNGSGLRLLDAAGQTLAHDFVSFDHFA
jgi:thiamine-monophosphate kinase